jgi:Zn-dependent peptidase ImmA (M78 family)
MSRQRKWVSETARRICSETGLSDPVEGAITLAESLTLEAKLDHPGQNLKALASYQGAKIQELAMDDAGRLIPIFQGDFDYLIQVNAEHPQPRKNFSVCHELGHTLMPNFLLAPAPRHDVVTMTWNTQFEEEFLCDVAAAELLMPRREFIPRLRGCGMLIESIKELAEEFGASLEATALNIVKANVEDVAVIIWEKDWNKSQRRGATGPSLFEGEDGFEPPPKAYRIKLATSCGELRNYHFPHNKSIQEDSLIYQAAETTLSVSGKQLLPIGGDSDREFYTQSMSFPIRRDGDLERRVFTIVQLKPHIQN